MTTIDPVSAQERLRLGDFERQFARTCDGPRRDGCRDWRANRNDWRDRGRDWRRHHHNNNDNAAAAIFGLATGALLGGVLSGPLTGSIQGRDVTAHVERCHARYRSYDPSTNTFLGYDGRRHACRL
ncbi:MAG TPA: BA14K family protein [Methylomirabilota bacterium]|nr:BA14K family protein [Methylomirabilota bacterium]